MLKTTILTLTLITSGFVYAGGARSNAESYSAGTFSKSYSDITPTAPATSTTAACSGSRCFTLATETLVMSDTTVSSTATTTPTTTTTSSTTSPLATATRPAALSL